VAEALGAQVEQLSREVIPDTGIAGKTALLFEGILDCEMLFECNFTIHLDSPVKSACAPGGAGHDPWDVGSSQWRFPHDVVPNVHIDPTCRSLNSRG